MADHPHFDSKGMQWHLHLNDALAEAKRDGKHVLVHYGRKLCTDCKALVEAVMCSPTVRPEVESHFVLLATDCDTPEPAVRALGAAHMGHARSLPFVMYLDGEGKFIFGTQGRRTRDGFLHDLLHGREDHAPH